LTININLTPLTPTQVVHFDYNISSQVVEPENSAIKRLIKEIHLNKEDINKIIIIGHASPPGEEDYNEQLGLNRGTYIADQIKDTGIDILSISNGEYNPVSEDVTKTGNAKNQRAEIIIIKRQ